MATKKYLGEAGAKKLGECVENKIKVNYGNTALTSMQAVEATTNNSHVVGAGAIKELNDNLDGLTVVQDETGKITGYKTNRGADTVFPFKSEATVIKLSETVGRTFTIDIKSIYEDWGSLTVSNFLLELISLGASGSINNVTGNAPSWHPDTSYLANTNATKSYNQQTGIFTATINVLSGSFKNATGSGNLQGTGSCSASCGFIPYLIV